MHMHILLLELILFLVPPLFSLNIHTCRDSAEQGCPGFCILSASLGANHGPRDVFYHGLVSGVISHVNRVHAPVLIYIVTIQYHPGCLKKSVNSVIKDLIKVDCVQVISQQLSRLQDMADKCKTLTKATEAQVSFFQQAHQLNRSLFYENSKMRDLILLTDLKPE
jgi:hypothetical protein